MLVRRVSPIGAGGSGADRGAGGTDAGMELGGAHPMGPLKLCALSGIDTVKAIADSLHDEFKDPSLAPPPLLLRMVDAGMLGRKSGRGFYAYG